MQHPEAIEVFHEIPDLLDEWPAGEVGVVGQALVAYGNRLQHDAAAYPARTERYFTSRVRSPANPDSSTVASMIARLSSRSTSATGLGGPFELHDETVVAQAEGEVDAALVVNRASIVDEVVRRLGDGQLEVGDLLVRQRR